MDAWHFLMIMYDWGMVEGKIPQPYLSTAAAKVGERALSPKGRGIGAWVGPFFFFSFLKKLWNWAKNALGHGHKYSISELASGKEPK